MDTPEPFTDYLNAWNSADPAERARLLERSVSEDVEFVDPRTVLRGREALAAEIAHFQQRTPGVRVARASCVDRHHDRARYAWSIFAGGGKVMDGLDAVQLDAEGRLLRIDGFFGPLLPQG